MVNALLMALANIFTHKYAVVVQLMSVLYSPFNHLKFKKKEERKKKKRSLLQYFLNYLPSAMIIVLNQTVTIR